MGDFNIVFDKGQPERVPPLRVTPPCHRSRQGAFNLIVRKIKALEGFPKLKG